MAASLAVVGLAVTAGFFLAPALVRARSPRRPRMTRLRDQGGEPKNVDWIIWLWKQKPQGRWS
jgi:hypothetical protein